MVVHGFKCWKCDRGDHDQCSTSWCDCCGFLFEGYGLRDFEPYCAANCAHLREMGSWYCLLHMATVCGALQFNGAIWRRVCDRQCVDWQPVCADHMGVVTFIEQPEPYGVVPIFIGAPTGKFGINPADLQPMLFGGLHACPVPGCGKHTPIGNSYCATHADVELAVPCAHLDCRRIAITRKGEPVATLCRAHRPRSPDVSAVMHEPESIRVGHDGKLVFL